MTNAIWGSEDAVRFPGTNVERNDLTMLPNGGYVVTWREATTKIGFQLYNGLGEKVGAAQFVTGSGDQRFADVHAVGSEGDFVVTWSENNGSVSTQKFNVLGAAPGPKTELPTAAGTEDEFALAANSQGGWATAFIEGFPAKVKLVEYDSSGAPGASVEIAGGSGLGEPDVAYLGGSKYLVSYRSDAGVTSKIVENGVVGNPIFIAAPGGAVVPHVAALKDANGAPTGEFVVVTDPGTSVSAQKYSATGEPIGSAVAIVAASGKDSVDHDMNVTALKDGGYAVVYAAHSTNPDGSGDLGDIFVKAIHGDGSEGQPIRVNARAPIDGSGAVQDTVVISEMADGRLSVAWHDRSAGNGLISAVIVDTRITHVTVAGTSHDDIYVGSDFDGDILDGAGGNDLLIGGMGADILKGGAGTDTASFQYATAGVTASLATGGSGGEATGDTYIDIENLLGSDHHDHLTGDDNANTLMGGAGNDTLVGGGGVDRLDGGAGSDTVSYAERSGPVTVDLANGIAPDSDVLVSIENVEGTADNDTFIGNGAINVFTGGLGNDTYFVQNTGDYIVEGANAGNDTVNTTASYTLSANVENLIAGGTEAISLTGNDLNNVITGNGNDNVINGGLGADVMTGGGGNDIYYADNAGDIINDTSGNDTVVVSGNVSLANFVGIENIMLSSTGDISLDGNAFANTVTGNNGANVLNGLGGDDVLEGLGGNDVLYGGDGNDLLKGGDGIDVLYGLAGHDTLYGGAGKDTLYGGTGRDVFVFDTRANKSTNLDRVADFSVKDDSIWLDNAVFSNKIGKGTPTSPRKLSKSFFKVGTKAGDKDDYFIYNKAKATLYYDSDGSGRKAMIEIAKFDKKPSLTVSDLFVI